MKRSLAGLIVLSTLLGCSTPEERAARRAEKEQARSEKQARRAQEEQAEQAQRAEQEKADAARAEQERAVNVETACKAIADAYSKHCKGKSSSTYLWCVGTQSPAAPAALNNGQTQACSADIGQADCDVLAAGVLPASCAQMTPALEQASNNQGQKDPGGISVGKACGPLMEQHCNKCDPSDMKACVDQSLAWCFNGRDGNYGTGMTSDQYSVCSKAYRQLRCDAANTGYVPMDCPGLR